ncbi:MAG: nucleotidyl transferase AbiEii/AbiGii toxin family protein [Phycisphaerales bacterium]|nr:nucleotidyl transferase AbiEii/AbiGii toxin family protein [Phycisphaerales bacterium]
MKLFEHPDFQQAVLRTAQHFQRRNLRPAMIEKDYFVTEVLRLIAATMGDKVIFKGGTSLSKGWNLIQRFSEDIDIFLDPMAFTPELSKNGINRELKRLRDAIGGHSGMALVPGESQTIGGFGRNDRFSYPQRFGGPGEVVNRVLLEAGCASGREPVAYVKLQSHLGQFLAETSQSLGAEDESPFAMRLLHFRRTFVEKMFAIHAKVELFQRDQRPIGSYARHYYDLYQLSNEPEVLTMLKSQEYTAIKADYDRISRAYFARSYFCPDNMSFANSAALFPRSRLAAVIAQEYQTQCRLLCYGAFPDWEHVQARFEAIRGLL